MLKSIIYVSSDDRSGSTILDLMLGNHSKITSLGEVHHLRAYATEDRDLYNPLHPLTCMCGKKIADCEFWKKVEKKLGMPLKDLRLTLRQRYDRPRYNVLKFLIYKFVDRCIENFPRILNIELVHKITGYRKIAIDCFRLYNTVAEISRTPYVIDSSKLPYRFKYLFSYNPRKTKIILLCRDPLGVVYSKMKRGACPESASKYWLKMVTKMEILTKRIPQDRVLRIRYEDICTNTELEMQRICDFLGLNYEPTMTILNKKGRHHIGGSPSKFEKHMTEIKIDSSFIKELSYDQMRKINSITRELRRKWGYSEFFEK